MHWPRRSARPSRASTTPGEWRAVCRAGCRGVARLEWRHTHACTASVLLIPSPRALPLLASPLVAQHRSRRPDHVQPDARAQARRRARRNGQHRSACEAHGCAPVRHATQCDCDAVTHAVCFVVSRCNLVLSFCVGGDRFWTCDCFSAQRGSRRRSLRARARISLHASELGEDGEGERAQIGDSFALAQRTASGHDRRRVSCAQFLHCAVCCSRVCAT